MDNKQAIGYMLLACKNLNLERNLVQRLFKEMYFQYDFYTEEEAEYLGLKYFNSLE